MSDPCATTTLMMNSRIVVEFVRKLPDRGTSVPESPTLSFDGTLATVLPESSAAPAFVAPIPSEPPRDQRRARIAPLAEDIFKFQFIEKVKKERFAAGRKPRAVPTGRPDA